MTSDNDPSSADDAHGTGNANRGTASTAELVATALRTARSAKLVPSTEEPIDARLAVERVDRRLASSLATAPVLDDAAALLDRWRSAATDRGIAITGYHGAEWLDRLAATALEMAADQVRDIHPRTVEAAETLLEAVAQRLGERGITTVLRDTVVALPRTPTSPAWGVDGEQCLAIGATIDHGWILAIDQTQGSLVVEVTGRADLDGIDAVLELADAVNTGRYGTLLQR